MAAARRGWPGGDGAGVAAVGLRVARGCQRAADWWGRAGRWASGGGVAGLPRCGEGVGPARYYSGVGWRGRGAGRGFVRRGSGGRCGGGAAGAPSSNLLRVGCGTGGNLC